MHHLRMPLMVGMERLDSVLAIRRAISHSNGAALQFVCFSGKGMGLEIMHHLEFVFDITEEHIGSGQRIGHPLYYLWIYPRNCFTRAAASRNTSENEGPEDASRPVRLCLWCG